MKTMTTRTFLAAMGMVLTCGTALSANELRFTDIEQRLGILEAQSAAGQGVQPASYLTGGNGEYVTDDWGGHPCVGCDPCCSPSGRYYAEFQFLWMRPHITEGWHGKLSERHHLSTRTVLGYEDCCGIGGRVRYWHFDHSVQILDPETIGIRLEVLDLELTRRFQYYRTDLLLGTGIRWAGWKLDDDVGDRVSIDAVGLTMALDVRTLLCCSGSSQWSVVNGGRVSILGGDWRGDNNIINTVVDPRVRDDNFLVTELYTGLEYMYHYCGYSMFARSTLELQNWRSDVLGEPFIAGIDGGLPAAISPNALGSTNSIGFLGLGFHLGLLY